MICINEIINKNAFINKIKTQVKPQIKELRKNIPLDRLRDVIRARMITLRKGM